MTTRRCYPQIKRKFW